MSGAVTTMPRIALLVITHGVLGIVLLWMNIALHPPWQSLFYWWLAPFDTLGLLATALLAFKPVRAWGGLLGVVTGGLECVALFYLAAMIPTGSFWPSLLLAVLAAGRLAAVGIVVRMETAGSSTLPPRGCVA